MPLVRTTILPDPIDVPEDEIPVLRHQGLLAEEPPTVTAATADAKAAPPKQAKES